MLFKRVRWCLLIFLGLSVFLVGCSGGGQEAVQKTRPVSFSLSFDGKDDYVRIPGDKSTHSEWTLGLWLKPDTWNTGYTLRHIWTGLHTDTAAGDPRGAFHLRLYSGRLELRLGAPDEFASQSLENKAAVRNLTGWHHVAVTQRALSGETRVSTLYLDGERLTADTGPYPDLRFSMWLGAKRNASNFYRGLMDRVTLWSSPLNPEELRAVTQGDTSVRKDELLGHWGINRGENVMLIDRQGSSDGTIHGATWSNEVPQRPRPTKGSDPGNP